MSPSVNCCTYFIYKIALRLRTYYSLPRVRRLFEPTAVVVAELLLIPSRSSSSSSSALRCAAVYCFYKRCPLSPSAEIPIHRMETPDLTRNQQHHNTNKLRCLYSRRCSQKKNILRCRLATPSTAYVRTKTATNNQGASRVENSAIKYKCRGNTDTPGIYLKF